ncbi:MAG TPA: Clp protease N-terminal domain-containing protein [Candidatus Aquilonibacter sp.]|nr:Clp protease N-terminal domain-containing protein [Candidatus Aquilonibacter sp.]
MNWFDSAKELLAQWKAQGAVSSALSNFTPRALQVFALARKEADRLKHNYIGTEHLLLGLIKLGNGVAVNVLINLGLNLEAVRLEVEKRGGIGEGGNLSGSIPYTPRVKRVLKTAKNEAMLLGHKYVGTEHLLLGLLQEYEGLAAQIFKIFNVEPEATRRKILEEITPIFPTGDNEAKKKS